MPAYALVVTEGPDAGASCTIDGGAPAPILVGLGPACGLRLTDRQVSRRHAALEPTARQGVRITDLGSTNGTRVNGLAIGEAYLCGGEIIRLGNTTIRLDLVDARAVIDVQVGAGFGRVLGSRVGMHRLCTLL